MLRQYRVSKHLVSHVNLTINKNKKTGKGEDATVIY